MVYSLQTSLGVHLRKEFGYSELWRGSFRCGDHSKPPTAPPNSRLFIHWRGGSRVDEALSLLEAMRVVGLLDTDKVRATSA